MKRLYKILVLAVFLLFSGAISAQILSYDFENLNVGDKIAETLGDPWTTWSLSPGSGQDALVSDEQSIGSRSLKIDNGNDIVLKLGDKTTGAYKISFDMFIPEGKEGYFNVLHNFVETSGVNKWIFEVFLNCESHGGNYLNPSSYHDSYFSNDTIYPFDVPYDEWFNVEVDANLDYAYLIIKINGDMICKLIYTEMSLAALDLFSSSNDPNKNGFYIDNINLYESEEILASNIIFDYYEINKVMLKDLVDTISIGITQSGNAPCRIDESWIDYGIGADSDDETILHHDNDPYWNYGNYNNAPYIEIGASFFFNKLLESNCIGTKITKMQYFLPYSSPNGEIGCTGPMTYRVYSKIDGEILAEKVLDIYEANAWNEVVFDEPIPITTSRYFFVTVGFQQIEGGYPISLDSGPSIQSVADIIRLNGGEWFSLNANAQYYGQQDYGNHNIRLVCQGEPVDVSWITPLGFDNHKIYWLPGQSNTYKFVFNSVDHDYGKNEAVWFLRTNDDNNPDISIPIQLKISDIGVDENVTEKYNLYPNPAKDIIHIDGDDLNCAVLYNSNGQMINIVEIIDNTISVNELDNGIYYLNIINKNGESAIQKIIVSR